MPLRVLSWATRFFWIITFAFAVTCVYSATLIRVDFCEPIVTFTEEDLVVALPIVFDNKGYYGISDLNITTLLADCEGRRISETTTYTTQIPPQENATIFHNVAFDLREITARPDYLFNDSNFTLFSSVQLNYASLIPFALKTNITIPWGAPLHNFTAGVPEYTVYNTTHLRVQVPIKFQNNSPYFNVTGTIRIEILNSAGQLVGMGTVSMDVPFMVFYDGRIEALVSSRMTETAQILVYVETEMFDCTVPLV